MKISNWLLRYDEKFLSIVKDDHQRKDYLNQLYQYRVACIFLLFLGLIMTLAGIIWDKNWAIAVSLILSGVQGFSYLDTDSRIMTIRLYELLSVADKKV